MYRLLAVALVFLIALSPKVNAQEGVWSLQSSIQYALAHNISIQQNVLNQRLAALTLKQSRLSQIPSLNGNAAYGRSFGRSVDPTTNQFVSGSSYDFMSLSGSTDVLLFGWFQKRNTIAKNSLAYKASSAELDQLKDDVSLNVATGYLRALLADEQVKVNRKQVELSKAQLEQTRSFAAAGRVPELDLAQVESKLAGDSATLISAIADYNSAILDMKALLNLDFDTEYIPERPEVALSEDMMLSGITPEEIYAVASKRMGSIHSRELRLSAAQKGLSAAKGGLWPTLSLSAQAGTNYSTTVKTYAPIVGGVPTIIPVPGTYATDANNNLYPVFQSTAPYTTTTTLLGTQFDNNFRQTVSLNLNLPIFNAWQAQYGVRQAKINVENEQWNKYQAELKLKQDVYKAHNDAVSALQKYYAADRAVKAAQRAQDFAQKRYDIGLTNTVDYLTVQNDLFIAESRLASAKFDLVFKLKVIDYYLGRELKL